MFTERALKGVFAKNERGYRLNAIKKALLIATNLTSICCVCKKKIVKDVSYRITSVHIQIEKIARSDLNRKKINLISNKSFR